MVPGAKYKNSDAILGYVAGVWSEKFGELAGYRSVERLIDEVYPVGRSEHTVVSYLKGIRKFIAIMGIDDVDGFIERLRLGDSDPGEVYREFVARLSGAGYAPKSVAVWAMGVKRWFQANGVEVRKRIRLKTPAIYTPELPDADSLRAACLASDARTRAIILFLASSGVRVGELVRLRIRDVDLRADPPRVRIEAEAAKSREGRVTFLTNEAKHALLAYFEERRRRGHKLAPDAPVFAGVGRVVGRTPSGVRIAREPEEPLSVRFVEALVTKAFSAAGVEVERRGRSVRRRLTPHSLRRWFKTRLIAAGVPGPIADRLCGHRRYLAESYELYTEDQLARWYKRAEWALTVLSSPASEPERADAAATAIGRDGTGAVTHVDTTPQVLLDMSEGGGKARARGVTQKVVAEDELEAYLNRGWRFVAALSNGRVVVERLNF